MTTLQMGHENARPVQVRCDSEFLNVSLADGRMLRAPLWWYPRLFEAPPAARNFVQLMPMGMHWPQIDEDISIASMLRGERAPGAKSPASMFRLPESVENGMGN